MQPRFWQIEHTADVAIRAEAPELPTLFDRCAAAMFSLIAEGEQAAAREEHPLAAGGGDLAELLVDFLRELLWLHHSEAFLYSTVRFEQLDETSLRARVAGEPVDAARHHLVREIKAVTYHGLAVSRRPDGWSAQIVFDV
jgi:SHS2 domain-containing protein